MEVKQKAISGHNQNSYTTAQPEKKFLQPMRSKCMADILTQNIHMS
jgi:hypothetical protein